MRRGLRGEGGGSITPSRENLEHRVTPSPDRERARLARAPARETQETVGATASLTPPAAELSQRSLLGLLGPVVAAGAVSPRARAGQTRAPGAEPTEVVSTPDSRGPCQVRDAAPDLGGCATPQVSGTEKIPVPIGHPGSTAPEAGSGCR
ncbi:MAG: hypothetical protein AMXMBFR46_11800 [Acidimicrobiia bacterium]